jgi:hypothetical protein
MVEMTDLLSYGPLGVPIPNGAKSAYLVSANVTALVGIWTLGGL